MTFVDKNCLIHYAESEYRSLEARPAIHLLFRQQKNVEQRIFKP